MLGLKKKTMELKQEKKSAGDGAGMVSPSKQSANRNLRGTTSPALFSLVQKGDSLLLSRQLFLFFIFHKLILLEHLLSLYPRRFPHYFLHVKKQKAKKIKKKKKSIIFKIRQKKRKKRKEKRGKKYSSFVLEIILPPPRHPFQIPRSRIFFIPFKIRN